VPESSNIEIVHRLTEHRDAESAKKSWQDLVVEILEAVLLGVVAVATAWSAYHAAKWDGREAELYAQASTLRIEANELDTLGGQQRLLDVSTFNTWIQARNEFRVAFDAWLKTNPFSNPTAPPGPSFMPEYRNPQILQGAAANREAGRISTRVRPPASTPRSTPGRPWCSPLSCSWSRFHRASGRAGCGSPCSS
jgi:hypothetical protein